MSLPKKGKGRKRYTTATITTNNKVMSNAMIKLLCYQSSKVSNAKNSSNIQVCVTPVMFMKYIINNFKQIISRWLKKKLRHQKQKRVT